MSYFESEYRGWFKGKQMPGARVSLSLVWTVVLGGSPDSVSKRLFPVHSVSSEI